jgi:hypothetical protein
MPDKPKKSKPFSATKYSTDWYRKNGYIVGKTEMNQRVPNPAFPGQFKMWKVDLFGFCDLLAAKPGEMPIFCQTTTTSNQANRIEKIAGLAAAKVIVGTGHARLHVHGWGKKGPRGGRKVWQLTITQITFDDDGLLVTEVISGGAVEDEDDTPVPPLLKTAEVDDEPW